MVAGGWHHYVRGVIFPHSQNDRLDILSFVLSVVIALALRLAKIVLYYHDVSSVYLYVVEDMYAVCSQYNTVVVHLFFKPIVYETVNIHA